MSIKAGESQKPRILTPAGTFIGRCFQIWDMGTQKEKDMKGIESDKHKIRFTFEIPSKTYVFDESKGPQPHSIGIDYNMFMNDQANLRQTVEAWTGIKFANVKEANAFDLLSLLGKPCTLTVVHTTAKASGNEYANIKGITTPMEGVSIPAPVNPIFQFDFNENFKNFDKLPKYFQDKIANTPEYNMAKNPVTDLKSDF